MFCLVRKIPDIIQVAFEKNRESFERGGYTLPILSLSCAEFQRLKLSVPLPYKSLFYRLTSGGVHALLYIDLQHVMPIKRPKCTPPP